MVEGLEELEASYLVPRMVVAVRSVLTPGRVQRDVKVLDCCYSLMRTFLDYKLDFSKLIFSE